MKSNLRGRGPGAGRTMRSRGTSDESPSEKKVVSKTPIMQKKTVLRMERYDTPTSTTTSTGSVGRPKKIQPTTPASETIVAVKRRGRPPKSLDTSVKSEPEIKKKVFSVATPVTERTKRTPKPNPKYVNDDVVSLSRKGSDSSGSKDSDQESDDFKSDNDLSSDEEFEIEEKKISGGMKRKSPDEESKIFSRRKQSFSTPTAVVNKVGRKRKQSESREDDEEDEEDAPVKAKSEPRKIFKSSVHGPLKKIKTDDAPQEDFETTLASFTIVNINDIMKSEQDAKLSQLNRRKTMPNSSTANKVRPSPLPVRTGVSATNSLPTLATSTPLQSRTMPAILTKSLSARRTQLIEQQKIEDEKKAREQKARQEQLNNSLHRASQNGGKTMKDLLKGEKPRILNSVNMGRSGLKPSASVIAKIVDSKDNSVRLSKPVQTIHRQTSPQDENSSKFIQTVTRTLKTQLTKSELSPPANKEPAAQSNQRPQLMALQKLQQAQRQQMFQKQRLQLNQQKMKQNQQQKIQVKLPQFMGIRSQPSSQSMKPQVAPSKQMQARPQQIPTKAPIQHKMPIKMLSNSLPTVQQQPKFVISRKVPTVTPMKITPPKGGIMKRLKKVTCFETWYVINMAEIEKVQPFTKPHCEFSLTHLGNQLKEMVLPSPDWTYKVTLQKREHDDTENENGENECEKDVEEYTGEIEDEEIAEEDRKHYIPMVIMFKRKCSDDDNETPEYDRTVQFSERTFELCIDGKNVHLSGAPNSLEDVDNVQTLLQIVNDVDVNNSSLETISYVVDC